MQGWFGKHSEIAADSRNSFSQQPDPARPNLTRKTLPPESVNEPSVPEVHTRGHHPVGWIRRALSPCRLSMIAAAPPRPAPGVRRLQSARAEGDPVPRVRRLWSARSLGACLTSDESAAETGARLLFARSFVTSPHSAPHIRTTMRSLLHIFAPIPLGPRSTEGMTSTVTGILSPEFNSQLANCRNSPPDLTITQPVLYLLL